MLKFEDFKPITLNDIGIIKEHQINYPPVHSDNSFTNMFCWNDYAAYRYLMVEDSLIIISTIEGVHSVRGPFGSENTDLFLKTVNLAAEIGGEYAYQIFDVKTREKFSRIFPDAKMNPDRDFFDYIYKTSDLKDLPGKKYLTIRKHLNKFRNKCRYTIESITEENLYEVEDFLIRWCEWKECSKTKVFGYEKDAAVSSVKNFVKLGLSGLIIRVEDNISAISIFEELNTDTAIVHFEKGLPDCQGNYKGINNETAKVLSDRYEFINRESDLGLSGLRDAKIRYHPCSFAEVHYVKAEDLIKVIDL
ncbi:DUF2156 domain-containing protein [Methanoplanus limicola]|uniref:Uncharacterized conserved protein UCP018688 n=1 Tax=Methanoplanus limicola DSM 2279 TaxID=937775 RepID=H1Z464_9EURY|nr:phosphatidylglycerol lysyltransferase domain-containing protein [Methanoplanus limicola]EHQ35743.1 Uncharacterized conserved protein UCP018688 [Methanoplanus limicola DSM 2279]